jgi:6-phosphofructokinase 1
MGERVRVRGLAAYGIDFLTAEMERGSAAGVFAGLTEGKLTTFLIKQMPERVDIANRRPLEQW